MTLKPRTRLVVLAGTALLLAAGQAFQSPAADLAALTRSWLSLGHPPDWSGIERLPGIQWAALPPTSLANCLPNGDCFTRTGSASAGGRTLVVVATGARTMVNNLFIRNAAAAFGEEAVLAALRQAELTAELARCPVRGGNGTTSWYRLRSGTGAAGMFAMQTVRSPRPSEGFTLSAGDQLPRLQPNQVAMYTEQCAPGAVQAPVSSVRPHERLAEVIVAFLVPASAAPLEWRALPGLATGIEWDPAGPKPINLSYRNDPNPMMQTGSAAYGGRQFSVQASGTAAQVKAIYLEETGGRHPRGEHMLGVVYTRGIAVRLVRCGPIYTESTNNWYSLQSSRTRAAMILQSINYDGNNVADTYTLRLDGTLPATDSRDRAPGVNGCQ